MVSVFFGLVPVQAQKVHERRVNSARGDERPCAASTHDHAGLLEGAHRLLNRRPTDAEPFHELFLCGDALTFNEVAATNPFDYPVTDEGVLRSLHAVMLVTTKVMMQ